MTFNNIWGAQRMWTILWDWKDRPKTWAFKIQIPRKRGPNTQPSPFAPNPYGRYNHHLEDHLCPGHAFYDNLSVTGRCLPHHLWANGREVEQDHLQGVGVQQQLWGKAEGYRHFPRDKHLVEPCRLITFFWLYTKYTADKHNYKRKIFVIPIAQKKQCKKPQFDVV
jgi:hypothetical protein